jgi:hypothetical protein
MESFGELRMTREWRIKREIPNSKEEHEGLKKFRIWKFIVGIFVHSPFSISPDRFGLKNDMAIIDVPHRFKHLVNFFKTSCPTSFFSTPITRRR